MKQNATSDKRQATGPKHIYVMGTGVTKFGELWGESVETLAKQAAEEALEEARLKIDDVDLLVVGNMLLSQLEKRAHVGRVVGDALGYNGPAVAVEAACASGGMAVYQGVATLKAGEAERVLVVGVEKMTDVDGEWITRALMGAGGEDEQLAGATFPALYGLMQQAYQEKYRVNDEAMAAMAVLAHAHGVKNPKAQFQKQVSVEQVLKSPLVAEPIRVFNSAPISDGAAALVLSTEKPNTKNRNPIEVIGYGVGGDWLSLAKRKELTTIKATTEASKKALRQASVQLSSRVQGRLANIKLVDVVEIHDCFSVAGLMALEDLGFCTKGEAAALVERMPDWVNPSGGLKACGHPVGATGVKQVVEITRQLQGQAGKRQVKNAKIGLTQNVGGTGATAVVHVLQITDAGS